MSNIPTYFNDEDHKAVQSNKEKWPIYKLSDDKEAFLKDVVESSLLEIKKEAQTVSELQRILGKTYYLENIRINKHKWKVDPKDDSEFWSDVKKKLTYITGKKDEEAVQMTHQMLHDIALRYAEEIFSTFKVSTYRFAEKLLPIAFKRFLNTASARNLARLYSNERKINDKINFAGNVDLIRKLSEKGTIILTPTHFSNLDSILIGWGVHSIGLPAMLYGAGLNLFNSNILGFYMRRMGAYKLDRRKKNPIYLNVLKYYSQRSIERGCHTLFFPGGTRSRTGSIETKLKKGLLGTVIKAQLTNCKKNQNDPKKIFILPLTVSYHFVLEARSLIDQHLKATGRDRYLIRKDDEWLSMRSISRFLWNFFSISSEIDLSFGDPVDIFGNRVDEHGNSYDQHNKLVNISDYFTHNGTLSDDDQRDQVYTKMISENIVKLLHKYNIVYSSHLLGFIAFELIKKQHASLDIYNILRLDPKVISISYKDFIHSILSVMDRLNILASEKKILLAPHLEKPIDEIIKHGIENLGAYHIKQPLTYIPNENFGTQHLNLLYFYHNRLDGYGLEDYV